MRWRILALLFLARVGLGLQFQTMASVGPDVAGVFGFDYTEIGVLIGLFMLPGLFLALPAGFLGGLFTDRILAIAGLAMLVIGGAISGFAQDPWMLGAGRVVAGAGFLFINLYFTKMVADWFEGREIATAMSILVMSWPFGIAMGQIGHTWLAATFDWRLPFFVSSVYCAVAALAVAVAYRPRHDMAPAPKRIVLRLEGREWALIALAGAAWGVFNAGYVVYLSFAPTALEALGHPALQAAAIASVGSWIMIGSGTVCGMIMDRWRRREAVLIVAMTGAVAAMFLLTVQGGGLAASLMIGLLGMAPAGVIMAMAGEAVAAERRAFGMGVFFMIYFMIMAASPIIAGALFDATERTLGALAFGAVLFAAVVPLALAFRHVKSRAALAAPTSAPARAAE